MVARIDLGGPTLPVMLRTVVATRYVTPLREGGSVPALVEADDDGLYVVKLLGAGHGRKALVAELLAGEIARHLGLPIPDLVLARFDARAVFTPGAEPVVEGRGAGFGRGRLKVHRRDVVETEYAEGDAVDLEDRGGQCRGEIAPPAHCLDAGGVHAIQGSGGTPGRRRGSGRS